MAVSYRDFELRPHERVLLVRGQPAQIGSRAFDLLLALVERGGEVVGKHELLDIVWPKLVVEENNLQVQIHALRKLLGPRVINTVPGRGYSFNAEPLGVRTRPNTPPSGEDETFPRTAAWGQEGNMPDHIAPLYGREVDMDEVRSMVMASRLVTITGASGIGKTRLAQAVAHQFRGQYADGVWMVELASLSEPQQVVPTVAQALGVQLTSQRPAIQELVTALRTQSLLLVLDNCEHLVDAVGRMAPQIVAGAHAVRIVSTSQEILRVAEERVYKLAPLAFPDHSNVADPQSFGAVKLFLERAHALDRSFSLDARNAGAVVDICRRLDGIPLAIELAAARVAALGVYALHERLGERLQMLTGGARVSLRRHQTLRAALDWSHNLLGEDERKAFRRLAVFSDGFSVEGAQLVCADAQIDQWAVLDILNALVDKSLVQVDPAVRPRYRLLESTRAYAMEKLAEAGETHAWLERHAESMKKISEMAAKQRDIDWMWAEMNNVRVAYAWALGEGGNPMIAIALATMSAMVLAVSGLVHEAMQRLLHVEPLVTPTTPPELAARYWQWLGRGGIEGRLPTSRCLQALAHAQDMFQRLGDKRHVHACLRMRAEAMVSGDDLIGAAQALREAQAMEDAGWPRADWMRRLRVEGMLDAAAGHHETSLDKFGHALQMAQAGGIHRYELILLADIARVHLDLRDFAGAATQLKRLGDKARDNTSQGLTRAHALADLAAALVGDGKVEDAAVAASEAMPLLRRCGTFLAHCDIYAWLLVNMGQRQAAARVTGAADVFHSYSEIARDSVKRLARAEVVKVLESSFSHKQIQDHFQEGALWDESAVAGAIEAALTAGPSYQPGLQAATEAQTNEPRTP